MRTRGVKQEETKNSVSDSTVHHYKTYRPMSLYVEDSPADKSTGTFPYGTKDDLPNEMLKMIGESGTATACVEVLEAFIQGDGFKDATAAALKVNSTQTADDVLGEAASSCAIFKGCAFYITRDGDGVVNSIRVLPFETVRKLKEETFIVNPLMGKKGRKKKEDEKYPAFRGYKIEPEELQEHIATWGEDAGEILYVFRKKAGQRTYPVAGWVAGDNDVRADAELSAMEMESVVNAFIPSAILTLIGRIDNTKKGSDNKTQRERIEDTLNKFTGSVKDANGRSGRQGLCVLTADDQSQVPNLQHFDGKAITEATNQSTERLTRKIARLFGVPPFLIGLDSSAGFNTKFIIDQITLLNMRLNPIQRMLSNAFKRMLPNYEWEIKSLMPVKEKMSDKVYDKLTDDEIRATEGYPNLPQKKNADEMTLQALNSMSPLVANKILEDMTPQQRLRLIGVTYQKTAEGDPGNVVN